MSDNIPDEAVQNDKPTEFKFMLTEQEANVILAGMSKLPYEVVAALIDKMKAQYAEQQ